MKKSIFLTILISIIIIPTLVFGFASGIKEPQPSMSGEISDMTSRVLGIIQWVGYAIELGMLMYIGIKYMMSAANEKANMKQSLTSWVIGSIVLFTASALLGAIVDMLKSTT